MNGAKEFASAILKPFTDLGSAVYNGAKQALNDSQLTQESKETAVSPPL